MKIRAQSCWGQAEHEPRRFWMAKFPNLSRADSQPAPHGTPAAPLKPLRNKGFIILARLLLIGLQETSTASPRGPDHADRFRPTSRPPRFRCATTPSSACARRSARISGSTPIGCAWSSRRPSISRRLLVVGSYVGLGLVVAASRYFAPKQVAAPQIAGNRGQFGSGSSSPPNLPVIAAPRGNPPLLPAELLRRPGEDEPHQTVPTRHGS